MEFDGPVPGLPGAVIRGVRDLTEHLADGAPAGPFSQVAPGRVLIDAPGSARILARDGAVIEVAVPPGADPGKVLLLLHGSARGALIHQRGELPLHAATLAPPGGGAAVAICGASGAGKSTLAAELSRRGWRLVADDTTRVTWGADCPLAWPSRDSIKLWRDACEALGLDVAGLIAVTADLDKYYVPTPARREPIRLGVVVELSFDDDRRALSPAERMSLLTRHTYRLAYVGPLGRRVDFARLVARVAGACAVAGLPGARTRPVGDLADAIERLVP